jgi:hypothetical protein
VNKFDCKPLGTSGFHSARKKGAVNLGSVIWFQRKKHCVVFGARVQLTPTAVLPQMLKFMLSDRGPMTLMETNDSLNKFCTVNSLDYFFFDKKWRPVRRSNAVERRAERLEPERRIQVRRSAFC